MARMPSITIENARLLFRNFSGAEGQYNRAGDRNFFVIIDDQKMVDQMIADGWNVKQLKQREDEPEEIPPHYIKVKVNFNGRPPNVQMVTSRGKTRLDENTVGLLDWPEIEKADLIINPNQWEVRGETGISAYLQTGFITIREDELERKYADVQDSAVGNLPVDENDEAPF